MSRDSEWESWARVIIERKIARGENQEQVMHGVLTPMRAKFRELYMRILAEREKAKGAVA